MPNIVFENFNGISDSLFSGIKDSFYKLVGLDIHSIPGAITVHQKLTKHSDTTITGLCKVSLSLSDGSRLWFDSGSGKIWRESSGTYTLVYTTSAGAGNSGCLGAKEYNTFIYWATQSRLHRIPIANIATAQNWTDNAVPNWQTFTITDSEFHPMVIQNQTLFIGDANYVASVDDTATFTANALDLVKPNRVKTIAPYDIDLILGTIIATNVNYCEMIRWDTIQTTWQYNEPIRENGVNAFLWIQNALAAQCGTSGRWYVYDGEAVRPFKQIPGIWTPTKYGEVYPNATGNFKGIPIFAFSNSPDAGNSTGNPADQGIYSMGNYSKDYPLVLSGPDFIISRDKVATIEIGTILVEGMDLYCSWKDGTTYGIDKLDWSNKYASAYLETLVITPDLHGLTTFLKYFANYQSLPAGCSLTFSYKETHASSYTALTTVNDTILKQLYAETSIDGRCFQLKVAFTISSNDAPVLENIGILTADQPKQQ